MALTPDELGYFQTGTRRIRDTYGLGLAQNNYARQVAGDTYSINKGNLVQQYANIRNQLPGSYVHRGLINSGLYAQGLQQYGTNRNMALGNLAKQYQDQLSGFNLSQQQLGQVQTNSLADLAAQKTNRIATLAALFGG